MSDEDECEFCKGLPIQGICFPTGFDDREESRDGKVWIARHDECRRFGSDLTAAFALSAATGWEIHKSYDKDDEVDPKGRAEKAGTLFYRPYFAVTLNEAYDWEVIVNDRNDRRFAENGSRPPESEDK